MSNPDTQWLTIAQFAEQLGVSSKTVRRRITDGTIPAIRIGRLVRIDAADLASVGSPVHANGNAA